MANIRKMKETETLVIDFYRFVNRTSSFCNNRTRMNQNVGLTVV